jgi:hypothetical protein
VGAALQEAQEESVAPAPLRAAANGEASEKVLQDRIREIIKASRFEWTTIGRIMKKTGLSHDAVTNLCAKMSDIDRGRGRKTHDSIYKFKVSVALSAN